MMTGTLPQSDAGGANEPPTKLQPPMGAHRPPRDAQVSPVSWAAGGTQQAPDLDLGYMFEMVDGQASVIQPLGGYFGDAHNAPWILLDKDDRTGAASDGENLYVYRPEMIRRLVVFALIYEGAPDFKSVGGVLTIRDGNGAETVVELNNPDANRTFCAIAMVSNTGSGIEIRKEERYFTRHRECDGYFQFGFEWEAGRK